MRGAYETTGGEQKIAPLLVKFPANDGVVIFTSFHNEKQNSETETKLLRYLVFAAVTAEVESRVVKTMVQGGFKPAQKGTSTLTIDIPQVTPGDYKYSVTALQLPNENFAYTVTVGQK